MKPDDLIECRIALFGGEGFALTVRRQHMATIDDHLMQCVATPLIFAIVPEGGLPMRIPGGRISGWRFVEIVPVQKQPIETLIELQIEVMRETLRQLRRGDEWRERE